MNRRIPLILTLWHQQGSFYLFGGMGKFSLAANARPPRRSVHALHRVFLFRLSPKVGMNPFSVKSYTIFHQLPAHLGGCPRLAHEGIIEARHAHRFERQEMVLWH